MKQQPFTLVELVVSLAVLIMILLTSALALSSVQRPWKNMIPG